MNASFQSAGVGSFSYQHLQGVMLLNLNKISSQMRLTHSEYRVMAVIIGLWNKKENKAFPTIDYLSNICCMGKATILKNLNKLVMLNLLVVVKTKGKRNNYYLGKKIFDSMSTSHVEPKSSFTCRTTNKHNRYNNKEKTMSFSNNNYTENIKINEMLSHKYWKHLPSGKIIQVKPDIGTHILIRYDKDSDYITVIDDETKSDHLKHFIPAIKNDLKPQKIDSQSYSKEDIINNLIKQNKYNEAKHLAKLFKIPYSKE